MTKCSEKKGIRVVRYSVISKVDDQSSLHLHPEFLLSVEVKKYGTRTILKTVHLKESEPSIILYLFTEFSAHSVPKAKIHAKSILRIRAICSFEIPNKGSKRNNVPAKMSKQAMRTLLATKF